MSVRTFNRRFREETGESPGAWLLAQRVSHARHLLETTDARVEEVAASGRARIGRDVAPTPAGTSLGVSPWRTDERFAAAT